jgi:hypothetical protein
LSRASDELRLSRLEELVRDAAAYVATRPLTISGDLNLNASKLGVTEVLARRAFRDAAQRLVWPLLPRAIWWKEDVTPIVLSFEAQYKLMSPGVHNTVKGSDLITIQISFDLPISTSDFGSFFNSAATQFRTKLKFDF